MIRTSTAAIDEMILFGRGEVCLKFREVGPSIMNDYHLAVDDRLTGNVECAGNDRKPFRPVQAIAGKNAALSLVQVDLDPVADAALAGRRSNRTSPRLRSLAPNGPVGSVRRCPLIE